MVDGEGWAESQLALELTAGAVQRLPGAATQELKDVLQEILLRAAVALTERAGQEATDEG